MPTATHPNTKDGLEGLLQGLLQNGNTAVDSMKRVVDTVNAAFPDVGTEGPRQKIIDAAFSATHQVIDSSNQLVLNIVRAVEPGQARAKAPAN